VRPETVLRILTLTDSFGIHREAIFIPLTTAEKGDVVMLPDGRLRIVCPNADALDEWLIELRGRLEKMDLSKILKH
jgi:hypothetical protein